LGEKAGKKKKVQEDRRKEGIRRKGFGGKTSNWYGPSGEVTKGS